MTSTSGRISNIELQGLNKYWLEMRFGSTSFCIFYLVLEEDIHWINMLVLHWRSPIAHQLACSQQAEGGDNSPPSSTCETTPGVPCPVLGSSVHERHAHSRTSPVETTRMICGLKQKVCKEGLREFFWLEETKGRSYCTLQIPDLKE